MALTAKRQVNEKDGVLREHPVVASDILYQGALCMINAAGNIAPCSASAGSIFAGICEGGADNSAGAAGALNATVKTKGVFRLPSSGLALTNVGDVVYAADDETVTVAPLDNLQVVGRIVQYISATEAWVELGEAGTILGVTP